jgi:transposase-like protein
MSRRYTSEEKDHAIQQLIANHGDVTLTSLETGIAERTLTRWKRSMVLPPRGAFPSRPQPQPPPQPQNPIAADDLEALRDLQQEMLREAYNLVHSIEEAIDEAPLNQRVAALAQLIDRIMKLSVQLPRADDDDVQIAYDRESYEQDDPFDGASSESTVDPR